MRYCSIESCSKKHKAKGYCYMHYVRLRKHGSTDKRKSHRLKHGMSNHPVYAVYKTMLARCSNPNNNGYKHYGGRGIRVCDRWLGELGFINFYSDMGLRPSDKHSIDRIDNDKGYSPENCRWATALEQSLNKRIQSNNKSGIKGVYKRSDSGKWRAVIGGPDRRINLGSFSTKTEAIEARVNAEREYWGV